MLIDIVSPLQSSFILGRGIVDNAIVLQEFIYHMRMSKKKHGDVIYKLDLEKAYDRVDWTFLRETLQYFGFPSIIISL
jgi:predicted nucleic acid-binding protein